MRTHLMLLVLIRFFAACPTEEQFPVEVYENAKICDDSGLCVCPGETTDCGNEFQCFDLMTDFRHCGECNYLSVNHGDRCENGVTLCGANPECSETELCEGGDGICRPIPEPVCGPQAGGAECPPGDVCLQSGQCVFGDGEGQ